MGCLLSGRRLQFSLIGIRGTGCRCMLMRLRTSRSYRQLGNIRRSSWAISTCYSMLAGLPRVITEPVQLDSLISTSRRCRELRNIPKLDL